MMTSVDVSIIIPCYNQEKYIRESIDSALSQTHKSFEVIVIDDGSTDNSLSLIRSYGDKIRWESGPNNGAPIARNRGLELARGKFIKFLDADDILLPDCLQWQIRQAMQLPAQRRAVVYGDAIWVDQEGHVLPGYPHQPRRAEDDPVAYMLANSPLTSCPLHRRDYLIEVNGFDSSVFGPDEHDLHMRLALSGVDFVYFPRKVYCYRQHESAHRLTNEMFSHSRAIGQLATVQKQIRLIESTTMKPLAPPIRRVFAQRLWALGRAILRAGHTPEAEQYFVAAKSLDAQNCIAGNAPYPILVELFGPFRAETYMTSIRSRLRSVQSKLWKH